MAQTSVKDEVAKMIESLPETANITDIMEKLYFRAMVDAAFKDLDQNGGLAHEEVEKRMARWLLE